MNLFTQNFLFDMKTDRQSFINFDISRLSFPSPEAYSLLTAKNCIYAFAKILQEASSRHKEIIDRIDKSQAAIQVDVSAKVM